jgi:hypothetical protein
VPAHPDPLDQLLEGLQAHGLDPAAGGRPRARQTAGRKGWWLTQDAFERVQRPLLPVLQPGNPALPYDRPSLAGRCSRYSYEAVPASL